MKTIDGYSSQNYGLHLLFYIIVIKDIHNCANIKNIQLVSALDGTESLSYDWSWRLFLASSLKPLSSSPVDGKEADTKFGLARAFSF